MNVIFTKHAVTRMKERRISEKIVLDALMAADKVEREHSHVNRFLFKKVYFHTAFKKDHLLMVVAERSDASHVRVITIY